MKTKVSVKLVYETDDGETSYRVQVWSIIKPTLSGHLDVNIKEKNFSQISEKDFLFLFNFSK